METFVTLKRQVNIWLFIVFIVPSTLVLGGLLTPSGGQGLALLGADSSESSTDNGAWVFQANGTWRGTTAASRPGHGLAWGDVNGDGNAELVVASNGATASPQGAFVWNVGTNGDIGSLMFETPTYRPGDGVAVGINGGLFVSGNNNGNVFIFNETGAYAGSITTYTAGSGIAMTTDFRGTGNPGMIVGNQDQNNGYGAYYYELIDSTWTYSGHAATYVAGGKGVAAGDIDGDGKENLLVAAGTKVFNFQYEGGSLQYLNSIDTYHNVMAMAVGDLTAPGSQDLLVEIDLDGSLTGYVYTDGLFNNTATFATYRPSTGSTGALIIDAINIIPEPATALLLGLGAIGLLGRKVNTSS